MGQLGHLSLRVSSEPMEIKGIFGVRHLVFDLYPILSYTKVHDMNINISSIFSSRARTKILQVILLHEAPIHLSRIAKLCSITPRAAQKALEALFQDKIVKRKRVKKYLFYYPNKKSQEARLARHVLLAQEEFLSRLNDNELITKFDTIIKLTDFAYQAKYRSLSLPSLELVFKELALMLANRRSPFILTNTFAFSIYRKEPRAISDIEFLLSSPLSKKECSHFEKAIKSLYPKLQVLTKKSKTTCVYQLNDPLSHETLFELKFSLAKELIKYAMLPHKESLAIKVISVEEAICWLSIAHAKDPMNFLALDDLQNIFAHKRSLDLTSLSGLLISQATAIPKEVRIEAPQSLQKLSYQIDQKRIPTQVAHTIH